MININYHKTLGSQDIIFDLKVEKGAFLGVTGPSGVGKTTLLRVLAGLESLGKGNLVVDEKLWSKDEKIIVKPQKRKIAFVFQEDTLFPHLSVEENLDFSSGFSGDEFKEYLIKKLNIAITKYPKQLSGGEKQRVAIARALLSKADYLLLDEPFSALDKELKQTVAQLLTTYHKNHGCTIVLVSHDEELVRKITDKTICLGISPNEKPTVQGVVLAGGKSTRMGTDKGFLKLDNRNFTEILIDKIEKVTSEKVVISANLATYEQFNRVLVTDNYLERGALGGLEAVMSKQQADYYLVVSCDSPLVSEELLKNLIQKSIKTKRSVWVKSAEKVHPLIAVYHKDMYKEILNRIVTSDLKMQNLLTTNQIDFLEIKETEELQNFNTPEEFKTIK